MANEDLEAKDVQKVKAQEGGPVLHVDEDLKADLESAAGQSKQTGSQAPAERQSSIQRFNEQPFIVAVNALLAKLDVEPKIGWDVEWQAVRRELKALYAEME